MDKSPSIIAEARQHVGRSCYVWGARGQAMSTMGDLLGWLNERETADSTRSKAENIARVLSMYDKLVKKGVTEIRGFDCSGFVYYVYHKLGLMSSRLNAASYYNKCTRIERADLRAGDLVFVHNGSRITHIGIYIGGNRVIHCKGRDVGVVEEAISKHGWNRYGRWAGVYDAAGSVAGTSYVLTLGSLNVRTGSGTAYTSLGIVRRGVKLPYLGTDAAGARWYKVTYSGKPAYISSKPQYTKLVTA
jgi:hypothetical protein